MTASALFCVRPPARIGRFVTVSLERTRGESGRLCHLDGLRALALIGVLMFHFGGLFPGGFLGVDIFFVLSGFLMTRAVLLQTVSGTFSLRFFVTSRVLRICPALFATLLATMLISVYVLPMPSVPMVCESASRASVFMSNVQFLSENGYHDAESTSKPLLHTWSLGVEGQFYLLWSLLAISGSVEAVILSMGAFFVASAAYHFSSLAQGSELFFLMPHRLYQFCFGSCAIFMYGRIPSRVAGAINLIGLLTIFTNFVLVRPENVPIALVSAPTILSTALIISNPEGFVSRSLLSHPVFGFLGKVSYSAYLVHWPAIVFGLAHFKERLHGFVFAAIVTTILSPLLYHCVEDRFKMSKDRMRLSNAVCFCVVMFCSIQGYGYGIGKSTRDAVLRASSKHQTSSSKFILQTGDTYRDEQAEIRDLLLQDKIMIRDRPQAPYVLVLGDSFSKHALPVMNVTGRLRANSHKFVHFWTPGCVTLPGNLSMVPRNAESREQALYNCNLKSIKIESVLRYRRPDAIVLIGRWQDFLLDKDSIQYFKTVVEHLLPLTKKVGVLGVSPRPTYHILDCLWKQLSGAGVRATARNVCPLNFDVRERELKQDYDLREALSQYPQVAYLPAMESKLCSRNGTDLRSVQCGAWSEREGPYYYDGGGHLTLPGSLKLCTNFASFLQDLQVAK